MLYFVTLCVALRYYSINYIFRENSRKINKCRISLFFVNAEFYEIKKTILMFYAKSISISVIFTYYYNWGPNI